VVALTPPLCLCRHTAGPSALAQDPFALQAASANRRGLCRRLPAYEVDPMRIVVLCSVLAAAGAAAQTATGEAANEGNTPAPTDVPPLPPLPTRTHSPSDL
jgi:hypothetical protein